jgi:hypothetical protein
MQQYSDFLEINQDFMPVYTEYGGRSLWKSYIPHKAFVDMLEALLKGLESGRPPWLQGPYGTGKTFAAYTLKHLFEEDLNEVKEYFDKHELLRPHWGKFLAARKDRPIFVIYYDSNAEDHADSLHLFFSLQQKIHKILHAHELSDVAEGNLLNQTLECLQVANWPHVFEKSRFLFEDAPDAHFVLNQMHGNPSPKIIINVVRALLDNGIVVRQSADDFRQWCQSLVIKNNIGGLIILCDELTDFIRNGSSLTDLQSLAAHNTESRFLFTPITHKLLTDAISDTATVRKIRERFEEVQFHMPTPTAFRLLKSCIRVRPERSDEWSVQSAQLKENVRDLILWLGSGIKKDSSVPKVDGASDLSDLLPLHPFAAALLSRISEHYLSSQRTLFSFIASSKNEQASPFQEFLVRPIDDNPRLLTADSLFHFFFMDKSHDLGDFADKAPLLINQYRQRESSLNNTLSRRLYATITLLQILRNTNTALDWQMPCESTLWYCYQGSVSKDDFDKALEHLLTKQLLSAIERNGDREFVSPDASIDHAKLRQYQDRLNAASFEKIMEDVKLQDKLLPRFRFTQQGLPQQQSVFWFATLDSLRKRRAGVVKSQPRPHQLAFVVCICQKDSEVLELQTICREISEENKSYVLIALDSPFTDSKLASVRSYLADANYYADVHDGSRTVVAQQKYEKIIDSWVDYASNSGRIFATCLTDVAEGYSGDISMGMTNCLKKTFHRGLWPYIKELGTLCQKGNSGPGTAKLVFGKGIINAQNKPLVNIFNQLDTRPASDNIKILVEDIRNEFVGKDEVNLYDFWNNFNHPPYGLYDSPAACLIIAHALKCYVDRWYHYDEQGHGDMLNQDSLSNLSARIVKGQCKSQETLRVMSEADTAFCAFVRTICDLKEHEALFPDEARRSMNVWLNSTGYPLCALRYMDSWQGEELGNSRLGKAIDLIGEILADESGHVVASRKELMTLLKDYPALSSSLKNVLTADAMQEALKKALGPETPRLSQAMADLDISVMWLRDRLREHNPKALQYWTKDIVIDLLPVLEADFYLLTALNDLLGQDHKTLLEATNALISRMKSESQPLCVFDQPEVKVSLPFIPHLLSFLRDMENLNAIQRNSLASALARHKDSTRDVLWSHLTRTFLNWANAKLDSPLTPEDIDSFCNEQQAQLDLFIDEEKLLSSLRRFQSNLTSRRSANRFKKTFLTTMGADSPTAWSSAFGFPLTMVWTLPDRQKISNLFDSSLNPTPQAYDEAYALLIEHSSDLVELNDPLRVAQRFVGRVSPEFTELVVSEDVATSLSQFLKVQLGEDFLAWRDTDIPTHVQNWAEHQYRRRIKPRLDAWLEEQSSDELREIISDLLEDPLFGIKIQRKATT